MSSIISRASHPAKPGQRNEAVGELSSTQGKRKAHILDEPLQTGLPDSQDSDLTPQGTSIALWHLEKNPLDEESASLMELNVHYPGVITQN